MRPILAAAILLLGVSTAAPEPEYAAMLPGSFRLGGGTSLASLVEIESSSVKGDRKAVLAPLFAEFGEEVPAPAPGSDPVSTPLRDPSETGTVSSPSLDKLCNALINSAQDNDLPVAFFANLIWQESGLRNDVISSKGAVGIAQFMPETAQESGLENPFDPLQAIPASARLLRELRVEFGNLGFAAAAYNAGPKRVSEWLKRHRVLPRETRGYVIDVTGRSVEQWQMTPPADADLRFVRRLPCRDFPAFAKLEEEQLQQAQLQREQAGQPQAPHPQPEKPIGAKKAEPIDAHERARHRSWHKVKGRIRRAEHARHVPA